MPTAVGRSLAEIGASVPSSHLPVRCLVEKVLRVLPPDDAATLVAWIADTDRTGTWITAVMREAGHNLPAASIGRHRRGVCRCER